VLALRRLAAPLLLWVGGLAIAGAALQRPAPLLVNLGAGDAAFARGFRSGWERDGLRQTGATMFHWTLDGARLELPVRVLSGTPSLRIRSARFVSPATPITLLVGGRVVDRWNQPSRGWRIREVELGPVREKLSLQFRSPVAPAGLGVALDWVEVRGARRLVPDGSLAPGLIAWLAGLPALAGLLLGRRALCAAAAGAPLLAAAAVLADRFGGLVALASAGPPACLVVLALAVVTWGLARVLLRPAPLHLALAAATAALALLALSHPFFHYPDVDTHAAFVRALIADPGLAFDPTPYQRQTGAWTREVGGQKIGFPYSPAFHALAAPLAPLLGFERAVETTGVLALGATSLLVAVLATALGLGTGAASGAQALLALLPVTASRLTLALFPALLGQALELALATALALRFPPASIAGRLGLAALLLFAQAGYIGSSLTVPAIVALFALLERGRLGGRAVTALLAATLLTGALVAAVLYGRFLPTLFGEVLPHAAAGAQSGPGAWAAAQRLYFFFGPAGLLLVPLGVAALRRAAPGPRRAQLALLLAGAGLLALRYRLPGLFRDVKEMELLTPPAAIAAAAALGWLAERGRVGQALAVAGAATLAGWGVVQGATAYGSRFLAVGL
jgi:hypothetical protein